MGGNGLSVADGTADIDFTDGVDTYGFKLALNSSLTETRGSAYAGQISSGGQTYQDAEPWKRKVYDNWLGGLGQISDNKVYGGTGIGGDDTKYFYADATTDRAGYLLPGPARNLVYNTIAGQMTPISSGADPNGGDEYEIPRGVVPFMNRSGTSQPKVDFTASATVTLTAVRVLVWLKNPSGTTSFIVSLNSSSFLGSISASNAVNYTGWNWLTCNLNSGTGSITSGQTYTASFVVSSNQESAIGCSILTVSSGTNTGTNKYIPYFQLYSAAGFPYKWWQYNLCKVEQLLSGTTYINAALTAGSIFNLAATGTAGTAGTSPERGLGGNYAASLVFNNNLYVGTSGTIQVNMYTPANVAGNAAPTSTTTSIGMSSAFAYNGYIYAVNDPSTQNIYKWTGAFPVTIGTIAGGQNLEVIVSPGTIGDPGTNINNIFLFQGNIWVLKPEGLFQLYADPAVIGTQPGNTPRIIPVVTDLPTKHQDTGKWFCIHQGMIYFNYRDRIYQVLPGLSGPPQVTVITLPVPWYRLSYYHYVNGITSDGVSLYVSWNNLGVFKYVNQTWHPVTEFYEQVGVESQSSGLRWLPNPAGAPDNIFVGDGRTIVQLPEPSAASPYTSQIYQNHQNKCGYWISSATDMDQAEIVKYIQSVIMRAVPSGFSYKLVPVANTPDGLPSFKTLLEASFIDGLSRDSWNNWYQYQITDNQTAVVTKNIVGTNQDPNSTAPACWVASDFNNLFYSSEKFAYGTTNLTTGATEVLTRPSKFVKTAFILYFWNPVAGQHATTGVDLMAVDSLVVKYQAVQDYLASYQCVIDFHLTVSGTGSNTNTTQQIEDAYEWLRSQTGRHSPLKATFRKRVTGDVAGKIKTVYFLPQNPGWISDPTLTALAGGDPGEPLIKTVSLQMVATTSEYANV